MGHHHRWRHYAHLRGKNSLLSYEGKGKSNSLCLLLMFRGLNDVLQDVIQQQQILPPLFLMTLWFNPSLFTIPRKMFQSPLDLWPDTSNLCFALACLAFVFFYCTQAHPIFRAIRFYDICVIYSMSRKSDVDYLFWFSCQTLGVFACEYFDLKRLQHWLLMSSISFDRRICIR